MNFHTTFNLILVLFYVSVYSTEDTQHCIVCNNESFFLSRYSTRLVSYLSCLLDHSKYFQLLTLNTFEILGLDCLNMSSAPGFLLRSKDIIRGNVFEVHLKSLEDTSFGVVSIAESSYFRHGFYVVDLSDFRVEFLVGMYQIIVRRLYSNCDRPKLEYKRHNPQTICTMSNVTACCVSNYDEISFKMVTMSNITNISRPLCKRFNAGLLLRNQKLTNLAMHLI
jgi:hypothetical protein